MRFAGTTKPETRDLLYDSKARKAAGVRMIYHQLGSTVVEHSHLDLQKGPDLTEQRKGMTPKYIPLVLPGGGLQ